MKLAVVAGGWHWPLHFYREIAAQANGADLFVVSHRSPELSVVRSEKRHLLAEAPGALGELDREMYREFPTIRTLENRGWNYQDAPNTVGDWGFFNQWLESHDYRQYDVILNCHDDTYIRRRDLFGQLSGDWLLLANGQYPQAPAAYVRGSFEFWKRELLELLGGQIPLGPIGLTREGKTDTPSGIGALSAWNDTGVPLRRFMSEQGLSRRIAYLSPYYRISPWVIEGERGFLHWRAGAPWSFEEGLKAHPVASQTASSVI